MSPVIEISGLAKAFHNWRGRRVALSGFDMRVEAGQVHGFLGPNGSGKTTTLRTLLGLVNADSGRMSILGVPAPVALPAVADRVGAIVESPQFFGNFTGRHTLKLLATAGGLPLVRVDEVLELVGLRDRANERVRAYSLGMKQRLAVASALLKRPELLILDEPANGLDPAGIRDIRELLRHLAAEGATVLISSHILAEVEQICDSVTIISRGRRVTAGPVGEVLASHDKGEFRVRVADLARAAELITAAGHRVSRRNDHLVVSGATDPAWISQTLGRHDLWIAELTPLTPDLESVFLELTSSAPVAGVPRQISPPVDSEVEFSVLPSGPDSAEPGVPVGLGPDVLVAPEPNAAVVSEWARPRDEETRA